MILCFILSANVNTRERVKYKWTSGETTQNIRVNKKGEYCVTIETSQGCTSKDCIEVDFKKDKCEVEICKTRG